MKKILLFIVLLLSTNELYADVYNLPELIKSVVRVNNPESVGSGTVFMENKDRYYILTNKHVIKDYKTVKIDFFEYGKHVKRVQGNVEWGYIDGSIMDVAILSVKKSDLGSHKPVVIPLADPNMKIQKGMTIYSIGLPYGRWPMLWMGHISNNTTNNRFEFTPNAFPGQSGSAILMTIRGLDKTTKTKIVGLVGWRHRLSYLYTNGKLNGRGISMRVSEIHKLFKKQGVVINELKQPNKKPNQELRKVGYFRTGYREGVKIPQTLWLSSRP